MSDLDDDQERFRRARMLYFCDALPRAIALVRAFALGDVRAVQALGPTVEPLPAEPGPPRWLDPLNYPLDQAEKNDDHALVFGLVHLVIKLAREWGITAQQLVEDLDKWTTLPESGER